MIFVCQFVVDYYVWWCGDQGYYVVDQFGEGQWYYQLVWRDFQFGGDVQDYWDEDCYYFGGIYY